MTLDRRDFIRLGAVGIAGLGVGAKDALASSEGAKLTDTTSRARFDRSFLLDRGIISYLDEDEIARSAVWTIPPEYAEKAAALTAPLKTNLEAFLAASPDDTSVFGSSKLSLQEIIELPALGGLSLSTLSGEVIAALMDEEAIDVRLSYFDSADAELRPQLDYASGVPFLVPKTVDSESPNTGFIHAPTKINKPVYIGDWQFRIIGPENDSLGRCERNKVKHFNLHISLREKNRWKERANIHIGVHKKGGQRCLVLWESVLTRKKYSRTRGYCKQVCKFNTSSLREMIAWSIVLAAAAAGVVLTAAKVAAMASSVAAVMILMLAVL